MENPSSKSSDILEDKTLTVDSASVFLGLHPKTVCAYIREGKIRAVRCGRRYRIRRQWLLDFLDNEQVGNSGE